MGRWVTSKGRRIYIPDEGEENPFKKESTKEKQTDERNKKKDKDRETLEKMKQYPTMRSDAEFKEWLMDNGMSSRREDFTNEEWRKLRLEHRSKQISKDNDEKEKQIAENKKQADERNDKDWENGYHVEHTDYVGGKFVDKGKVGDYKIGEKVNYLSDGKLKSGTINKAHIYPNGKIDYNVVDKDGDGHNVSSNNLAKTDANRFKQEDKSQANESNGKNLERKLAQNLKKSGHPQADKEAYNLLSGYRKGDIAPEDLRSSGLSQKEIDSLRPKAKRNNSENKNYTMEQKWKVVGKYAGESAKVIPDNELKNIVSRLKKAGIDSSTYEKEIERRKRK